MKNLFLCAFVLLAACGGNSNATPPSDPSSSSSSSSSTTAAPASTDGASDGKCGTTTTTSATDMDMCKAECEKLDDKAPAGSRCIPPRTSCKMACDQKFKK